MTGCIRAQKGTSKSIEADIKSVEFTRKSAQSTSYVYTELTIYHIDQLSYSLFQ